MKLFRTKKHEYDEYFYGLVIAKSKALLTFVRDHPRGGDYARKKIIDAKKDIAKLNPVLHGFLIRGLSAPSSFKINNQVGWCFKSNDVTNNFYMLDTNYPYGNINYQTLDKKFYINNGNYELETSKIDIKIYISVYNAIEILHKNRKEIDFNVEKRKCIQKYNEEYGQGY